MNYKYNIISFIIIWFIIIWFIIIWYIINHTKAFITLIEEPIKVKLYFCRLLHIDFLVKLVHKNMSLFFFSLDYIIIISCLSAIIILIIIVIVLICLCKRRRRRPSEAHVEMGVRFGQLPRSSEIEETVFFDVARKREWHISAMPVICI